MLLDEAAKAGGLVRPLRSGSTAQKAARQDGLHISAAVGDQVDYDPLVEYSIHDAVGLKENLAVLPESQRSQFFRS